MVDRAAGRFVDAQSPFKTVVVVSYSAFDTFVIPGTTKTEKKRLDSHGEIFGYIYCGLREREESNTSKKSKPIYRLKTPSEIEFEFVDALRGVHDLGRQDALIEVLNPLFARSVISKDWPLSAV